MTNTLNFAVAQEYVSLTPLNDLFNKEVIYNYEGPSRMGTYNDGKGNEVLLTEHTSVGRFSYSADIYGALEVADMLIYPFNHYSYDGSVKRNPELRAFKWALDYRRAEKEKEEKERDEGENQQQRRRIIILCVQVDSRKKFAKEVLYTEPRLVQADYNSNKFERYDVYMIEMNPDYVVTWGESGRRRGSRWKNKFKNKKDAESSEKEYYNGMKLENLAKGFVHGLIDFYMNKDEEDKVGNEKMKKKMKGYVDIYGEKKRVDEERGGEKNGNTTKKSSYSISNSFFNAMRELWWKRERKIEFATTTTTTKTATKTTKNESTNKAVAFSA